MGQNYFMENAADWVWQLKLILFVSCGRLTCLFLVFARKHDDLNPWYFDVYFVILELESSYTPHRFLHATDSRHVEGIDSADFEKEA